MDKLRTILVGLGFWGERYLGELRRRTEEFGVAGIVARAMRP